MEASKRGDEVRWKARGKGGRVRDREKVGVTDPLKETCGMALKALNREAFKLTDESDTKGVRKKTIGVETEAEGLMTGKKPG